MEPFAREVIRCRIFLQTALLQPRPVFSAAYRGSTISQIGVSNRHDRAMRLSLRSKGKSCGGTWKYRDLTSGDISSYFNGAVRWYENFGRRYRLVSVVYCVLWFDFVPLDRCVDGDNSSSKGRFRKAPIVVES